MTVIKLYKQVKREFGFPQDNKKPFILELESDLWTLTSAEVMYLGEEIKQALGE